MNLASQSRTETKTRGDRPKGLLPAEALRTTRPEVPTPGLAPSEDAVKAMIYQQFRHGVQADALAVQHGRSRPRIARIVNEMRAKRLFEAKLDPMVHPSFDEPGARAEITGPTPVPPAKSRRTAPPEGLPPYLASLYEAPLLTREQEQHLFRKMNYLKYRAQKLRETIDPAKAKAGELDKLEALQDGALAVKNQLIRANLRLVVSIAKKRIGPSTDFFELVSDGNMSLIRAVEKFDYSRGNKFSTYASWAIMKNYARTIPEELNRRDRFVTGHGEMFEVAADGRSDERQHEAAHARTQEAVKGMLGKLDDRERRIIVSRFGLGGVGEQTLEQLGKELGITKERVRQIESRAQAKLRQIAGEQQLDPAAV